MSQTLYMPGEASAMVKIMCERVNLAPRAGSYILSMCRLRKEFPGGLVDMVEVAQIIKYASEHQEDLKPQFQNAEWTPKVDYTQKPTTRTWYKPANPIN
ncbi:hypothetical protein SEA_CATERPILLAR_73 [Arthrobacter phage Caterpillar]|nr:hypothetical protein SEA_CATERPILLAR_73 [Arthrobacter phage Caterpillar]